MPDNLLLEITPQDSAEIAGLKYISDDIPGIIRKKRGKGFVYFNFDGEIITGERILSRIKSLVIPPAWSSVWISPQQNGHIQATGRDARGRKQYIYHPQWDIIRNQTKFLKLISFGKTLPLIREKVEEHLNLKSLKKEKVLAVIISLLERTYIRVGNEEYAKTNGSYGLTTLRNKHVSVEGSQVKFLFKGKSGKQWQVSIKDRRIANVVKKCQELPGQELFSYRDEEGNIQVLDSGDVNQYLKEISGEEFTAKDFRTWNGTMIGAVELYSLGPPLGFKEEKRKITKAVKKVSHELLNTPTVCRKYYIHPDIFTSFSDGTLFGVMDKYLKKNGHSNSLISVEEKAVLEILEEKSGLS